MSSIWVRTKSYLWGEQWGATGSDVTGSDITGSHVTGRGHVRNRKYAHVQPEV